MLAAIVAFAGAAMLLILSIAGFAHLRRVSPEAEVFPNLTARIPATVYGTRVLLSPCERPSYGEGRPPSRPARQSRRSLAPRPPAT
jgi:hypothetical protein